MTHDERIKAMAEAIFKADFPDDQDLWDECEGDMQAVYNRMATAALAAAGVEEMVREAIGAYRDMLNDALSVDLENGVKWLSQRAAASFWRDYPELCRVLEADSEDDIVREAMGK
jgi:hypothetical protein